MAKDFIAKVTAELDTADAEGKLKQFLDQKSKLKIDVELNQDSAKKLLPVSKKVLNRPKLILLLYQNSWQVLLTSPTNPQ